LKICIDFLAIIKHMLMDVDLVNDDMVDCDIFALCTSSAERLRDLDLYINITL